jgi:hypothetical protein
MDLRVPSGWFFASIGAILIAVSMLMPEARAPLTRVNINLYCGLFMLAFGALLLWVARRSRARD